MNFSSKNGRWSGKSGQEKNVSRICVISRGVIYLGCDGCQVFPGTTGETWTGAAESNSECIQLKGHGRCKQSVWDDPEIDDRTG